MIIAYIIGFCAGIVAVLTWAMLRVAGRYDDANK